MGKGSQKDSWKGLAMGFTVKRVLRTVLRRSSPEGALNPPLRARRSLRRAP